MRKSIATIALAALAATGVACSSKADASESAYCQEARDWAIHELDPRDDASPVWFKQYWGEYLAFTQKAAAVAPTEIKHDWTLYVAAIAKQTPIFEKYGYDNARGEAEATEEEQAVFAPSEKEQEAFDAILSYEALTCDAAQPPPAKVDFSALKPGEYCDILATDNERFAPVAEAGMQPADVRAVSLDPKNEKAWEDLVRTAPSAIKDDVRIDVAWQREHQRPTMKKYGYDMRKIMRDGSAQDRRDLNRTDKRVRDHFARIGAYEEQVCNAEQEG
jgi:hypothetical protein